MGENIEAEVRCLVRQVSDRATQAGGMDRRTYDALFAASAALASKSLDGESRGREDALQAMRACLRACEVEPCIEAA